MKFVGAFVLFLKKIILSTARTCGLDLFLLRENYHYVPDIYGKNSNKMLDFREDVFFLKTADKVINDKKTLLYYDRLHVIYQSLLNIEAIFGKNKEKINIAEVGVYKGGCSYFISNIIGKITNNNCSLYCVDTFEGHSKSDTDKGNYDIHRPSWFSDTSLEDVTHYLSPFEFTHIIKGKIQDKGYLLEDKKFHFVHLDTDLYHPMYFSLNLFAGILQPGGIIIVDDYSYVTCPGVKKAVSEFMASHTGLFYKFELSTGQCLLIRFSS